MPKNKTSWTIWLVLALALLGQTVSASYGVSQMCDSLATESKQMLDGAATPHHIGSADTKSCCEESNNGNAANCEMHSCVIVGLQSSEFVHSVTFKSNRYHFDLKHQFVLVTLDSLYRPPIFPISS